MANERKRHRILTGAEWKAEQEAKAAAAAEAEAKAAAEVKAEPSKNATEEAPSVAEATPPVPSETVGGKRKVRTASEAPEAPEPATAEEVGK